MAWNRKAWKDIAADLCPLWSHRVKKKNDKIKDRKRDKQLLVRMDQHCKKMKETELLENL
jgi:hypothetical protein